MVKKNHYNIPINFRVLQQTRARAVIWWFIKILIDQSMNIYDRFYYFIRHVPFNDMSVFN